MSDSSIVKSLSNPAHRSDFNAAVGQIANIDVQAKQLREHRSDIIKSLAESFDLDVKVVKAAVTAIAKGTATDSVAHNTEVIDLIETLNG